MTKKQILPEDVAVGQRIRSHRLAAKLSQTDLANNLGVTFQQIQKYEKGVNRVSSGRLQVIAKVLGCDVTELLGTERPGPNGDNDNHLLQLGQTRFGHRLAKAFNDISNCGNGVRDGVVTLVEQIAELVKEKPKRSKAKA